MVAVAEGLDELKAGLRGKGYQVVDLEGYGYPIDAMVFAGNAFQISHVSYNNMPVAQAGGRSNYGVLMINATGKSLDMVDEMLKMRCYEHLF